jgi:hypothetical protein
MLPKLEVLRKDDSPMSYEELLAVSKELSSLTCLKGFDFDTAEVDFSGLIFSHLEKVIVVGKTDSDLRFIMTVLENSIPQGPGFLKSLFLFQSPSDPTDIASVEYGQLITSLIKIIEVRISLSLINRLLQE